MSENSKFSVIDDLKRTQENMARSATLISAPFDSALHKQAEAAAGHISSRAVSEEYNRLILQKYHRPEPRGFWARLFGR